jgi:hypothetical protein
LSKVAKLFREAAFDPEMVKTLCLAYDCAISRMHDTDQPNIVQDVIAQRIISMARNGEDDLDRLCAGALKGLELKSFD